MNNIVQLDFNDLQAVIKNCLGEYLEEIKSLPTPTPLPDRITLDEACNITGYSKQAIYLLTMNKKVPFQKFGKRLVFSRKELTEWRDQRTITPVNPVDVMDQRLAASAKKHLSKVI